MRKHTFRFVAASCLLGLLPATVHAQVDQLGDQREPATQQEQEGLNQNQQPNRQAGETDRVEARRVQLSAGAQQGQSSVQGYLATKMMLANNAEIELSQIATEKAKHQGVKQYAQKMIQEHQQLNQKLQQLQSGQNQQGQNQPGTAQTQASQSVPQQLTAITQRAAENHLQMAKESLQRYNGQDFDMAYLGLQIATHQQMLAGLQAIQDAGSQQFQQLVRQAEQATSQHLQQAKELARQFEDDRSAARSGSQSSTRGNDAGGQSPRDAGDQPQRRGGLNNNRN